MLHENIGSFLTRRALWSVLRALDERGVFLIRGAVRQVAQRLGIAQPTIYRWLAEQRAISAGKEAVSTG